MSHEITETDSLVLARKPAWHGLGTVVQEAPSVPAALQLAGLDWTVDSVPLQCVGGKWDGTAVPSHVANVRSDTGEILGVVGEGYRVLQNNSLADVILGLDGTGEGLRVETAGSLKGGRVVFFLVQAGSFQTVPGDESRDYVLFYNAHDGTMAFRAFRTAIRVVCANTARAALRMGTKAGIALRHTASLPDAIEEAKGIILATQEQAEKYAEATRELAKVKWTGEEQNAFFYELYQRENGKIPENPKDAGEKRKRTRALDTIGAWKENMERPEQLIPGMAGSAWAVLNAVTYHVDHQRGTRIHEGSGWDQKEARQFSSVFGSGAEVKARALSLAMERV